MEYEWHIRQWTDEEQACIARLQDELHISEPSARLLVARGISTGDEARRYVRPSLEALHDPFMMQDMDAAVSRLEQALAQGEKILVYGDYDVDGTTAVALVYSFLRRLTHRLDFYIPDRYTEGYGISFRGIDYAQEQGCSLIIALDCGIKAVDKVDYATQRGIDFIICDHHTPGERLPAAKAVLNMKRADCPYPFKDLSGCGVGFKLVQAYCQRHGIPVDELKPLLPLLAMSIASDIVSVTGENRILESFGLKQMNSTPPVAIQAIAEVTGLQVGRLTMTDLVYKIGPRINASGRISSGAEAVRLLISDDIGEARSKALDINNYNTERKDFDQKTTEEALSQLAADPDNEQRYTTVVYAPDWHKGVVGIAASRLTESYYRPTIVLTMGEDGLISGSARSVGGFDIYTAIDSCRDLLTHFGGHRFAAGLSLQPQNLDEFKRRFEDFVREHILPEQRYPVIEIEQELALSDITSEFFNILRHLEPFGPGNPRPVFLTRHLINNRYTKRVGKDGEHLRLDVTDRTAAITGIAFHHGDKALHLQNGRAVDVCYELDENIYNGVRSIQMMVTDIKTIIAA